jgi:hypothetical protein
MKEKIKLLSNLNNVLEDEEVLKLLGSRPDGERIVAVFKSALEKEIENIFNKNLDEVINPVIDLIDKIKEVSVILDSLKTKTITAPVQAVNATSAVSQPLPMPLPQVSPVQGVTGSPVPVFQGRALGLFD